MVGGVNKENMQSKFKVGDRVVVFESYDDYAIKGELGVIRQIQNNTFPPVAVEFENYNESRHDIGGLTEKGYGYYLPFGTIAIANHNDMGNNIHTDIQSLKDKYPQFNITVSVEERKDG